MKPHYFALLLATACFHPLGTQQPAQACSAASTFDTLSFDSTRVTALAGRFRLVQVLMSPPVGRRPIVWDERALTLEVPTPAQLVARRRQMLGRSQANLSLIGTWGEEGGTMSSPAEVERAVVYLGCRGCLDGSPIRLIAQGVSPDGFWGTWQDDQSGNIIVADPATGEPLRGTLTGTFCAMRMKR